MSQIERKRVELEKLARATRPGACGAPPAAARFKTGPAAATGKVMDANGCDRRRRRRDRCGRGRLRAAAALQAAPHADRSGAPVARRARAHRPLRRGPAPGRGRARRLSDPTLPGAGPETGWRARRLDPGRAAGPLRHRGARDAAPDRRRLVAPADGRTRRGGRHLPAGRPSSDRERPAGLPGPWPKRPVGHGGSRRIGGPERQDRPRPRRRRPGAGPDRAAVRSRAPGGFGRLGSRAGRCGSARGDRGADRARPGCGRLRVGGAGGDVRQATAGARPGAGGASAVVVAGVAAARRGRGAVPEGGAGFRRPGAPGCGPRVPAGRADRRDPLGRLPAPARARRGPQRAGQASRRGRAARKR